MHMSYMMSNSSVAVCPTEQQKRVIHRQIRMRCVDQCRPTETSAMIEMFWSCTVHPGNPGAAE